MPKFQIIKFSIFKFSNARLRTKDGQKDFSLKSEHCVNELPERVTAINVPLVVVLTFGTN